MNPEVSELFVEFFKLHAKKRRKDTPLTKRQLGGHWSDTLAKEESDLKHKYAAMDPAEAIPQLQRNITTLKQRTTEDAAVPRKTSMQPLHEGYTPERYRGDRYHGVEMSQEGNTNTSANPLLRYFGGVRNKRASPTPPSPTETEIGTRLLGGETLEDIHGPSPANPFRRREGIEERRYATAVSPETQLAIDLAGGIPPGLEDSPGQLAGFRNPLMENTNIVHSPARRANRRRLQRLQGLGGVLSGPQSPTGKRLAQERAKQKLEQGRGRADTLERALGAHGESLDHITRLTADLREVQHPTPLPLSPRKQAETLSPDIPEEEKAKDKPERQASIHLTAGSPLLDTLLEAPSPGEEETEILSPTSPEKVDIPKAKPQPTTSLRTKRFHDMRYQAELETQGQNLHEAFLVSPTPSPRSVEEEKSGALLTGGGQYHLEPSPLPGGAAADDPFQRRSPQQIPESPRDDDEPFQLTEPIEHKTVEQKSPEPGVGDYSGGDKTIPHADQYIPHQEYGKSGAEENPQFGTGPQKGHGGREQEQEESGTGAGESGGRERGRERQRGGMQGGRGGPPDPEDPDDSGDTSSGRGGNRGFRDWEGKGFKLGKKPIRFRRRLRDAGRRRIADLPRPNPVLVQVPKQIGPQPAIIPVVPRMVPADKTKPGIQIKVTSKSQAIINEKKKPKKAKRKAYIKLRKATIKAIRQGKAAHYKAESAKLKSLPMKERKAAREKLRKTLREREVKLVGQLPSSSKMAIKDLDRLMKIAQKLRW